MINTFQEYRRYLTKLLSKEDINNLVYYCEKDWYLQVLKEFGNVHALILIKYFEKEEKYDKCQMVIDAIRGSNKNFGTVYKETLEGIK